MRPHIIFLCLCLLALAVNVPAEENTETDVDSPRSDEELLSVRGKTKDDINIDETNTEDDDTGIDHDKDADATDGEETNYNDDNDNEEYEKYNDKNGNEDDKSGKTDEEEPAPEEPEEADTEREGFSPNEGGSRMAQGTADSYGAASPVDVQRTNFQSGPASANNLDSSKAEGTSTNQGSDFQNAGAGSLSNKGSTADLPPDGRLSATSNRDGSSQPLGPSPGSQASQAPGAEVANSVPVMPPVSSSSSQDGQSNPSPNIGSGTVASSDTQAQTSNGLSPPVPRNNEAPANPDAPKNLPSLMPSNNAAPFNPDAPKVLPPLGLSNNQAPMNPDAPKNPPPLMPSNNQDPFNPDAPKNLPPLLSNNNPDAPKNPPSLMQNNNLAPFNPDAPKNPPSLMQNNNLAPFNPDAPKNPPPLMQNNNLAPFNPDAPKNLPPLMGNNNQVPSGNSPGNTAGGSAPFQQPSLDSRFSSGVAGQSSYANKDGTVAGDRNQGANPFASSPGSQNTALSGLQAQRLGSLLAPGPVMLPSGPTKNQSDGLEFPKEAKPSPTTVFGRDYFSFQTRRRTTLSPWRGFGDLSTVPTAPLQISQGSEVHTEDQQDEDYPETSKDDADREGPKDDDKGDYEYNGDEDIGDEELPATEPGDGDWYYRKDDKAESEDVDESEAGDKDGKATSDNDDDTDNYYEEDYFGKGKEEEEQSLQAQYQDPGLNVLEEPKTDGESEPKDSEIAALEKATVKTKAPNKPTNMVLFYTWLILVVLIAVVTISTCKSRIVSLFNRGKKAAGHQRQPQPEEGKRLLEHEFV